MDTGTVNGAEERFGERDHPILGIERGIRGGFGELPAPEYRLASRSDSMEKREIIRLNKRVMIQLNKRITVQRKKRKERARPWPSPQTS